MCAYVILIIGYLTPEGYKVKKSKLEVKYSKESVADLTKDRGLGSIADSIGKPPPSTHSKLLELFKKNSSKSAFDPSQTSSSFKPKLSRKKTSKGDITSKRFTIIDCGFDIVSVPKEKAKLHLRDEDRINQVLIDESNTELEIREKIVRVFPQFKDKDIAYLVPTQCNDLFEAEEPPEGLDSWMGNAFFQTYASGTIYIRLAKKYQQFTEQGEKSRTTKIQTVKPVPKKIPTVVNPVSYITKPQPTYEIGLSYLFIYNCV